MSLIAERREARRAYTEAQRTYNAYTASPEDCERLRKARRRWLEAEDKIEAIEQVLA